MQPLRMFLKSTETPNFIMSVKSIEAEMDKNGCSYFASSLVPIELILRLHHCFLLAANCGQFSQISNTIRIISLVAADEAV